MAYRGSNLPAHEGSPDRIHEAPKIAPGRDHRSMPERAMHPADEQAGA